MLYLTEIYQWTWEDANNGSIMQLMLLYSNHYTVPDISST